MPGAIAVAAIELAGREESDLAARMTTDELTAKELYKLGGAGILDAHGVGAGIAYLQGASSGHRHDDRSCRLLDADIRHSSGGRIRLQMSELCVTGSCTR